MKEKRSKFAEPSNSGEIKETESQEYGIKKSVQKKTHDALHIKIAKLGGIQKWQVLKFASKLPERRSFSCSCVYKGRYLIILL